MFLQITMSLSLLNLKLLTSQQIFYSTLLGGNNLKFIETFKQPTAACRTICYYYSQDVSFDFTSDELVKKSPNKHICKPEGPWYFQAQRVH